MVILKSKNKFYQYKGSISIKNIDIDKIVVSNTQQTFVGLQDVFKTSSRRLQDMSWRRSQHVFSITIFCLPRRLEDVLKLSCKYVLKTSSRRLHVFKTSRKTSWRHLQDDFKMSWKTKNCYAGDDLKMSWRHALFAGDICI